MKRILRLLLVLVLFAGSAPSQMPVKVPSWAKHAIWYQIFPERFRNGDPSNDPTADEVEIPPQSGWHVTPWTSDWYKLQPWEARNDSNFYHNVFDRRYGGDLQGVIDKLDYLAELGVTAIYFNPLFEAFSLHKYDASCYHHIDNNFGPDAKGDLELMKTETDDPATWHWTAADKLFLRLVQEAHRRGMKVIIDGVFNHTGTRFFAFADVARNQRASRYAAWYDVTSWRDSTVPGSRFTYKSWWNTQTLPEFKEDEHSFAKPVWDYIFNSTRRWMDPEGDGKPGKGVDGWRLDVPNEVSHVFWKQWRVLVKSLNPDALIIGEIWDDARPWLQGDEFDAVMNYQFTTACVNYFVNAGTPEGIATSAFDKRLAEIRTSYAPDVTAVMQNLFDSHDTDRLLSMIMNPGRKFNQQNSPRNNADYNVAAPTEAAKKTQKLMALFQMTYLGAPMVYYGDEVGMWGGGDPDDRKPMVWADLTYDNEASHPLRGKSRPSDPVVADKNMFAYYQKLILIRKENEALRLGSFKTMLADDGRQVFAFQRSVEGNTVLVVLNNSAKTEHVTIKTGGSFKEQLTHRKYAAEHGSLSLTLEANTGMILVRK